ncbi:hypothetical protein N2601_08735 [Rhizobium sp. CB3060]|uniref:hypothetical protein n=1 Tax=Rhizobium sp. CB3060 TaxID=3138255 RepID=UPI0021A76CB8|nr:hypothetical protein [Rhizobium tropici]UWU23015.1 hypothetical protein N2601_08735 [Rhizobium tropici]
MLLFPSKTGAGQFPVFAGLFRAAGDQIILLMMEAELKPDMTDDSKRPLYDPHLAYGTVSGRRYIGKASEWRPILIAFDRFRRIELFDNADALYLLSDLVLHRQGRLPAACIGQIVLDGIPETGVFLDASLLRSLTAGCRELLMMARNDRFGAFRGSLCDGWPPKHGPEPLLNDDEDRAVRRIGNRIVGRFGDPATWRGKPLPVA